MPFIGFHLLDSLLSTMFLNHSNVILVTVAKNLLRELSDFQTTGKQFHL